MDPVEITWHSGILNWVRSYPKHSHSTIMWYSVSLITTSLERQYGQCEYNLPKPASPTLTLLKVGNSALSFMWSWSLNLLRVVAYKPRRIALSSVRVHYQLLHPLSCSSATSWGQLTGDPPPLLSVLLPSPWIKHRPHYCVKQSFEDFVRFLIQNIQTNIPVRAYCYPVFHLHEPCI